MKLKYEDPCALLMTYTGSLTYLVRGWEWKF